VLIVTTMNKCSCGRNKYHKARMCKQCKQDKALAFCPHCSEPILSADRFGNPYRTCYNCRGVETDIEALAAKRTLDEQQANNPVFIEPSLFDETTLQRVVNASPEPSAQRQSQQRHNDYLAPGETPIGTCSYCRRDLYADDLADLCRWCIAGQPDHDDSTPVIKPQPTSKRKKRPRLTDDTVRQVRRLHAAGGWSYAQLAKRFRVGKSSIKNAVKGKTYTHVV